MSSFPNIDTPPERLIIALLLLNGLTITQLEGLQPTDIDLEKEWIRLPGAAIPLVTQTASALAESPSWFTNDDLRATLDRTGMFEARAQRLLAGALWITSEDTRLISSVSGMPDAPILPLNFTFPFSIIDRLRPDEPVNEIAVASRVALQSAADWLERELLHAPPTLRQRVTGALLEGKTIFLISNTGVNGVNLLYNLVMGRLLSPSDYSQLALVITIQMLIGLLPSAWQQAVARFGAQYNAKNDSVAIMQIRAFGRRMMLMIGIVVMALGLVAAPLLASIFQLTDSALLLAPLLALPFFLLAAADRGVLQGINAFYWLSVAYVGESVSRFGIGALLVFLLMGAGTALQGAVWGVGQSMIITWFLGWLALHQLRPILTPAPKTAHPDQRLWLRMTGLTLTALIGQALITNGDFLLVKSLFAPADSGLYAAVSVLGRIAYFGALPLTIIMVPLFARRQALDQPTRPLFFIMLGGGVFFCGLLLLVATLFPTLILTVFFGNAYLGAASLLPLYTLAASLFVIVNLVITYRIALGKGAETILPLLAGIAQVIGILLFHQTLQAVILVQVVLMSILLAMVLWRGLRADG